MKIPLIGSRWSQNERNPDIFGLIPPRQLSQMQWLQENYQLIKTDKRLIKEMELVHKDKCVTRAGLAGVYFFMIFLLQILDWLGMVNYQYGDVKSVFSVIFLVLAIFGVVGFGYHFLGIINPDFFGVNPIIADIDPMVISSLYHTYTVGNAFPINDAVHCDESVIQAVIDAETKYIDG